MRRIRRAFSAIAAAPRRVLRVAARVVEPFRPADGTTEAAQYLSFALLAAGFVVRGQPELALLVPGAWIGILASAPVIVGILRRGS